MLEAIVEAVAALAEDSREVVACGLDHQGESVLAWDARQRAAADADRDLAGQALAGGARPARARGAAERVREQSGMPLDPYFSAGKIAWLLEHDEAVGRAREAGELRLGTVDAFICDRLGAGFGTDPSTASRTQLGAPGGGRSCSSCSACRRRCCPRSPTPQASSVSCGTAWPVELPLRARCVDQQAALAGAGCVEPGGARPPMAPGCSCSPMPAKNVPVRRWPAADGRVAGRRRVEWAIDGGVFTAGALLEWLSRDLGLAATRRPDRRGRGSR